MLKNNLLKDQLYPYKDGPAKNWQDFGVKLIFGGIIVFGVFSINSELFKPSTNNNTPVTVNAIDAPQSVLAKTASNTPDPSLLTIPSLNIKAPFEPLGLNSVHAIDVPKNNMGVGWFIYGPKPGEIGAALVMGNLDSASGGAVFANLSKIKAKDKISITRTDGSVVTYRVDSISPFYQDNFPTKTVYAAIPYAGLRLITCSGVLNKKTGHYSDNFVVFATRI